MCICCEIQRFFFLISILIQVDLQIYLQTSGSAKFLPLSGKTKISVVVVKKTPLQRKKRPLRNTPKRVVGKKTRFDRQKNAVWLAKKRRCNCKATPEFVLEDKKRLGAKIIAPGSKKAVFVEKAEILQASDVAGIHPSYRLRTRKLIPGTWNCLKLMQLPSSESPFKQGAPIVFGGLYTLKNPISFWEW